MKGDSLLPVRSLPANEECAVLLLGIAKLWWTVLIARLDSPARTRMNPGPYYSTGDKKTPVTGNRVAVYLQGIYAYIHLYIYIYIIEIGRQTDKGTSCLTTLFGWSDVYGRRSLFRRVPEDKLSLSLRSTEDWLLSGFRGRHYCFSPSRDVQIRCKRYLMGQSLLSVPAYVLQVRKSTQNYWNVSCLCRLE